MKKLIHLLCALLAMCMLPACAYSAENAQPNRRN